MLPSPWHPLGSPAEWHFISPKLGHPGVQRHLLFSDTGEMRDGDAGDNAVCTYKMASADI